MSAASFFDSNVLIYLFDQDAPRKRAVAEGLCARAAEEGDVAISHQVVQETLHVVTRKVKPPLTAEEAGQFLASVLVPMWRVMPSTALYRHALKLQEQHGFSFYDSLIVAAALEAGCKRLLTEDMQHGQRIEKKLTIVNPFLAGA